MDGFDALATGKFGVALRGPSFDSSLPEPVFFGASLFLNPALISSLDMLMYGLNPEYVRK